MFVCPNDHAELARIRGPHGISWSCPSCGGRAVGVGVLRQVVTDDVVTRLWLNARAGAGPLRRDCPACQEPMVEVATDGPSAPRLDVCLKCHFVWFDPSEFESLPAKPAPPAEPELPERAREMLATAAAEEIAARARGSDFASAPPPAVWQNLPGLLGMPVEYDAPALNGRPWMTWSLIAFIVGASIAGFFNLEYAVAQYGLIPADAWRIGGLTFFTSFLLHGGWMHLIGNMYFLFLFGDNVEDFLGKMGLLVLVLMAAIVGDLMHIAYDPRPAVPVIGASGGISGIVLYYALKYPRARLGLLLRVGFYFRWMRMPAYAFVGFWVLMRSSAPISRSPASPTSPPSPTSAARPWASPPGCSRATPSPSSPRSPGLPSSRGP